MKANTCGLLGIVVVMLTGCAAGNRHTFNYVPTDRPSVGNGSVVLLLDVRDERPYVLSGDEKPDFVGEQRSGYGIPFNVTTSDGRPFTEIVEETIQRDLEAAGFRVVESDAAEPDVAAAIRSANARRAVRVVMREFKSDTFNNINFDYDFEAVVYDTSGKEIARKKVAGEDELPGSMMNPPKAAKAKVPAEFYSKMRQLIVDDESMIRALTSR